MPSVKPHTMIEYTFTSLSKTEGKDLSIFFSAVFSDLFCVEMRHLLLCNEKTSSLSTAINISIHIYHFS